jgi:hypothetical protein
MLVASEGWASAEAGVKTLGTCKISGDFAGGEQSCPSSWLLELEPA